MSGATPAAAPEFIARGSGGPPDRQPPGFEALAGDVNDTVHNLKIAPEWWHRIESGAKTCEIRRFDRDYQAGDLLHLNCEGYPMLVRRITHVLDLDQVPDLHVGGRWVVLSLGQQ